MQKMFKKDNSKTYQRFLFCNMKLGLVEKLLDVAPVRIKQLIVLNIGFASINYLTAPEIKKYDLLNEKIREEHQKKLQELVIKDKLF